MGKTGKATVFSKGSLLTRLACLSLWALAAGAALKTDKLPQAVVAYGFLASHYFDYYEMVTSGTTDLARDLKAVNGAVASLDCRVADRMGSSHRAFIVPSSPLGQWIGFEWAGNFPPREGTLFVTEPLGKAPGRVWVIYSQVAPESTAVFWLEARERGYVAGLVYDTFCKGKDKVGNSDDPINAVTAVSIEKGDQILLKEWVGVRLNGMGPRGGVFQVDTARSQVTLKKAAP